MRHHDGNFNWDSLTKSFIRVVGSRARQVKTALKILNVKMNSSLVRSSFTDYRRNVARSSMHCQFNESVVVAFHHKCT